MKQEIGYSFARDEAENTRHDILGMLAKNGWHEIHGHLAASTNASTDGRTGWRFCGGEPLSPSFVVDEGEEQTPQPEQILFFKKWPLFIVYEESSAKYSADEQERLLVYFVRGMVDQAYHGELEVITTSVCNGEAIRATYLFSLPQWGTGIRSVTITWDTPTGEPPEDVRAVLDCCHENGLEVLDLQAEVSDDEGEAAA